MSPSRSVAGSSNPAARPPSFPVSRVGCFSDLSWKDSNYLLYSLLDQAIMALEYKDYYRILGVPKNADDKTIKSAYRRLARKHHPDVTHAKDAAERFKEINEAYAVLSDPDKRRRYD